VAKRYPSVASSLDPECEPQLPGFRVNFILFVKWTTRVRFLAEGDISLFATASRPALGPTVGTGGSPSLGVKRPWREADHSPPCSAEVKNAWSCTSNPHTSLCRDGYLSTETAFLHLHSEITKIKIYEYTVTFVPYIWALRYEDIQGV
jgi:hypothetical protein